MTIIIKPIIIVVLTVINSYIITKVNYNYNDGKSYAQSQDI